MWVLPGQGWMLKEVRLQEDHESLTGVIQSERKFGLYAVTTVFRNIR